MNGAVLSLTLLSIGMFLLAIADVTAGGDRAAVDGAARDLVVHLAHGRRDRGQSGPADMSGPLRPRRRSPSTTESVLSFVLMLLVIGVVGLTVRIAYLVVNGQ